MKFSKEKLFYSLLAPIIIAIAVYLFQYFMESRQPILSINSESGVLKITNNTGDALRVRAYYWYRRKDGTREACTSPDIRKSQGVGYPAQMLMPNETRDFHISDCPTDPDAIIQDFGVQAWNSENEIVFEHGEVF